MKRAIPPSRGRIRARNGAGLGASHQTGWTGLVAKMIQLFGMLDVKKLLEGGKSGAFVRGKLKARLKP